MATLVLTAVGTALGGPIGGAIGGLLGRQVDNAAFGAEGREGPRVKELAVTTSSYGTAIPRVFGRMRVAGSVIWSTDLVEASSTEGGKGQPSTTTYSYSASFAVALSSAPLSRIGRIWANGDLLRGANEDLKTAGQMRVYLGTGDDPVDPLIEADKGGEATGFRDCAYIVFEDLQLADFGNRIPALTFEVFGADEIAVRLPAIIPGSKTTPEAEFVDRIQGFSDEGNTLGASLNALSRVLPLACVANEHTVKLSLKSGSSDTAATLPGQLSSRDAGEAAERQRLRLERAAREPVAVRYYDEARDYQPGVQRANGQRAQGREVMIDLPATLDAAGAKDLANRNAQRARWKGERLIWRVGQLDPAIGPASKVRVPGHPGIWVVRSWEWHDRGIELSLERAAPELEGSLAAASGDTILPSDAVVPPTLLRSFEVPPSGADAANSELVFVAATAQSPSWLGASLYAEQSNTLISTVKAASRRAVTGALRKPLVGSGAVMFERASSLEVVISAPDLGFSEATLESLANGANRVLVGSEVIQFANATELDPGIWRLEGLLRGRGGTEDFAAQGHPSGTELTLLDENLIPFDPAEINAGPLPRIAAIGRGDSEPVFASRENAGLSRRPPSPVHPIRTDRTDGSVELCWTRRARGQWRWDSLFELPLVEAEERYLVGIGPPKSPGRTWLVSDPEFVISETEKLELLGQFGPSDIWVRQIGTYSHSTALLLTRLSID